MATGYEDIDNLMNQQNNLLNQQEQKQNEIINKQTQMQVDELNREKEKIDKDVTKTTQGLYSNWQKETNQYGVQAEQLAQQGLSNTGYAETTKTALYNTYQRNVTETLNNSRELKADYDFKISQARENGSVQQAQSALELYSQKMQLLTQNYELRQNKEKYLYQQQRDKVADQQWQKSFDQQAKQNEIENQWKQKNFDYQKQRDNVSDGQWQKSFDYQKQRDNVSDNQWQKSFDYQKQRDLVSDNQWQQQFNLSKKANSRSSSSSKSTKSSKKSSTSSSGGLKVSSDSNISDYAKMVASNLSQIKNNNSTGIIGAGNKAMILNSRDKISDLVNKGTITPEEANYIYEKVGL